MSSELSDYLPSGWHRWLPLIFLLVALGLGALGQREFGYDPPHVRNGLILYILGGLALLASRLSWRPAASTASAVSAAPVAATGARVIRVAWYRWALSLAALLLLGWVLLTIVTREQALDTTSSYTAPFWAWMGAILLAGAAWLLPDARPARPALSRAWIWERRWELAAVAGITLLAAWLRFNDLSSAPFTMSGDEGSIGMEVQRVLSGELRNPFGLIWGPHPSLLAFLLSIPLRLFGETLWALRAPNALFGALSVPALYWLARVVADRRVALAAALLLATFPMHLHYSRISPIVLDALLFASALAALFYGMRRERPAMGLFVLAGLLAGLDQYVYTGSRLLPLLIALYLAYLFIMEQARLRERAPYLAVAALIFCITAAPIYLYAIRHPSEFNARINQIGIVQSGWLEAEMAVRGEGALPILWDQFRRSLFGYTFFQDRTETWGPGTALAHPLLGLGLFLGLAISLRRWREAEIATLHGWFWGVVLGASTLTLAPPTSNRVVSITPVVAFFAALGWDAMARALARYRPAREQPYAAMLLYVAFIAATALTGARAYDRYLADNNFGGPNALIGTVVGNDLREREPGTTLVMLGAPRVFSGISPLVYLAPDNPKMDVNDPLAAAPQGLPAAGDLLFVVVPERAGEIPYILEAFPEARQREVLSPLRNEVLYHELFIDR